MTNTRHPDEFDPDKVPEDFADLFYNQTLGDTQPIGLSNEQYDGQKAEMQAAGTWPLDDHSDEEPGEIDFDWDAWREAGSPLAAPDEEDGS